MRQRPSRQQIETSLDCQIVAILVEPTEDNLEKLGTAIRVLSKMGYPLRQYESIYQELRDDYLDIQGIHYRLGDRTSDE